jgi:H+-transporting ATPase
MLEAAIVLELARRNFTEAGVIAALLVFNAMIGLFQEGKARAALAALKSRLALNAHVRRDGAWAVLPSAQVVPGDQVKLSLGAVVAADVTIRNGSVLLDQSMLTGESEPVEARAGAQAYAGALVRRGGPPRTSPRPGRGPSSATPRNWSARPTWSAPSRRPCCGSCAISPSSTAF